jgi:hypothetical protein
MDLEVDATVWRSDIDLVNAWGLLEDVEGRSL